ncbi:Alpha-D-kanosaminyltransferase [Microbacterium oxydans]|uniref:Alpha-D-kanosaminyltransferase n=1 Tax=Microbacterium oxydans TaxID=82380 RepID=A0A0F0LB46_9MICO|nr:glycosyltransferase [Microbacterium oxydans]KJL29530.1 Alpha-D-kanosaminyltransferase [Microbacterium oxydans]CAH0223557.1 Alpha-D-kanosaminyltransferase [Microbacterium oxydans]
MLVLIVHPGAELYGADRVTLESAAGLAAAGHDVVAALPEHGPLVAALESHGVRVVVQRMFVLRKQLLRPRNWPKLLASAVGGFVDSWRLVSRYRPDAAYVSTVVLPHWPMLLRVRRVRTITHVHEAEAGSPWAMRAFLYSPQLWAHTVIANSRFTANLMRRTLPGLRRKITVVLNPVPGPATISPPREHLDPIRIGYVGRLSPRKAPDVVISALAVLRDRGRTARLEIVGDVFRGYEWYAAELAAQITAEGLSDTVTSHGYAADIWPHVAACDVMIVPSRTDESFGNTAVESILAERPVIVSDLTGLREAVAEYPTSRVVPPGDAVAVADAIQELTDTWADVVSHTAAAAAAAADRHSVAGYRRIVTKTVESSVGVTHSEFTAD